MLNFVLHHIQIDVLVHHLLVEVLLKRLVLFRKRAPQLVGAMLLHVDDGLLQDYLAAFETVKVARDEPRNVGKQVALFGQENGLAALLKIAQVVNLNAS